MLARLGRSCFEHRWRVLLAWLAGLALVLGAARAVGPAFGGEFAIPDSESRDGFAVLDAHFGGVGSGLSGSIVFRADAGVGDQRVREAMEAMFAAVAALPGVTLAGPYDEAGGGRRVSPDGSVAFAALSLEPTVNRTESAALGRRIADLAPELEGLRVEIGGSALGAFQPPESEFIGLAFAVVVLILAFGSVLAMGLPIGVAAAGVGTGVALIALISNLATVPDFATTLGAMIGLGVGIDYALIVVTRYREELAEGRDLVSATAVAMATAGRAVIFAGLTVVISLLGMLLMGLAFVSGLAIGAATTVTVTMVASVTLLPALLGVARTRVEVTRWAELAAAALVSVALLGVGLGARPLLLAAPLALATLVVGTALRPLRRELPRRPRRPMRGTLAYRWSRLVQRHPWAGVLAGVALLAALAAPVLSLRLGFSDEGNFPAETTTRRAYDLLAEGFGPGFNGPLLITAVPSTPGDRARLEPLREAVAATPGVASVEPAAPSDRARPAEAAAYLLQVIPTTSPQDAATFDLVERLRGQIVPRAVAGSTLDVDITGAVAANIDFTSYLARRIVLFFGAVLALSFLLLMAVFRSVLVPLKAVAMNVLSLAAAYGVVVAIFQWGWLGGLLGVAGGPIEPFIPMMMFAIVFGLSMDYEVFLLSRVREEYDRSGDPVGSVADGLASTARVITAAAAIMVVVFGSFVFEDQRIIKLFGVGLSFAVLLDATVVRMLLVPATMALLGARNWWFPRWLDRLVPRLAVEASPPVPRSAGD